MHLNWQNLARLARMEELQSPQFRAFMNECNEFATEHSLRTFVNWSKIWEYPWLWHNGLGRINWPGARLLDLGSEISPMPWFIAKQGGSVTLVETDPQWTSRWEQLQTELKVDADWHVVTSERLPPADESVDVVTSFSVIEHQADKHLAMAEIARVLKPGGTLAISFDICEPNLGMTFPDWNGRALTLREFEEEIWLHPAFGNRDRPEWNTADIPAFREWHLQSAPHHNYVVGAAVLRKTK
jgi:2-polyprenyl-3-methyl-5-hydroxy-6-metoxy-1,4-benzoquinol methylase